MGPSGNHETISSSNILRKEIHAENETNKREIADEKKKDQNIMRAHEKKTK